MKKYILILGILLSVNIIFAQKISNLSPTLIVWKTNSKKISLKDAKYGINLNDSLSLNVMFHKSVFDRVTDANNLVFEFRWYYYLSTRRSLMYVDKVKYKNADLSVANVVNLKSTQKTLQKGWWEVQIVCSYDNGFIQIGDISKYQIFIK